MSREIDIKKRALVKLREHAHQILVAGYGAMTPSIYACWKEPAITGELCKAMFVFMASTDAPSWVVRYALRDDPKLDVAGKYGESRPRIDIELERVQRGERPKFRFEAKRLGRGHPASKYVGSEGLGALLRNYYPLTHGEAGMLGYVQNKDIDHWHSKLVTKLKARNFAEVNLAPGLSTWKSTHTAKNRSSLTIWHSLLHFC